MRKRAALACGGTGGHFYPGFAWAQALEKEGFEVLFIVKKDDPAFPFLEKQGLKAVGVDLQGLPRRLSPSLLPFFLKTFSGIRTLRKILKSWKPDVVIGMGAYVSFPAVVAGWTLGRPCLIHEANAQFGLANQMSLPLARKVALGLPMRDARSVSGPKFVLTGTPIRPQFWKPADPKEARRSLGLDPERKTVLVFGGSQGAGSLNRVLPEAIKLLPFKVFHELQFLLIAGRGKVMEAVPGVKVLGYLEAMETAFAASDLVLCRAGASTAAELLAVRKPAVLIPYPLASAGHQLSNARVLEKAGCALVFEEKNLLPVDVARALEDLLFLRPKRLEAMKEAYLGLNVPTGEETLKKLTEMVYETNLNSQ